MIEYISKTGLSFEPGQKLDASQLNRMNGIINLLVDAVNSLLSCECDINVELGDATRRFTLEEAIAAISNTRRAKSMKIRFLGKGGKYLEYSYIGTTLDTVSWLDTTNWVTGPNVIDGGIW